MGAVANAFAEVALYIGIPLAALVAVDWWFLFRGDRDDG